VSDTNTYNYIELCHSIKSLSVSRYMSLSECVLDDNNTYRKFTQEGKTSGQQAAWTTISITSITQQIIIRVLD